MPIQPGFYYGPERAVKKGEEVNVGAYEVTHSGEDRFDECLYVVFRPLFKDNRPLGPGQCLISPEHVFTMLVNVGGSRKPRYRRIEDEKIILALKLISEEMYPPEIRLVGIGELSAKTLEDLEDLAGMNVLGKTPSAVALRILDQMIDVREIIDRLRRLK